MAGNIGHGKVIIRDGKEIFVLPDGQECGMGLRLPADPKIAAVSPRLKSAVALWDEKQLKGVFGSSDRRKARDLFPPAMIKDQDGRSACVGYATAAGGEEAIIRAGGDYVRLSGDGVYAAINGGSDSGSMLSDAMQFVQSGGYPLQEKVPQWEYRKSRIPAEAYTEAANRKGHECYVVGNEQELLTALAMDMPVVIALQASGGFSNLDGKGIVQSGNGPGNHCVLLDDAYYDTELGVWVFDMRNSWRTSYGEQGRGRVTWKRHLATSYRYAKFFTVPTVAVAS